jgi:two-component system, chemotaxis family, chemotaxis protein CheY
MNLHARNRTFFSVNTVAEYSGREVPGYVTQADPRIDALIKSARVLIVDHEYYTRKVLRALLLSVGIVDIHDAAAGPSGLEAIRTLAPHIVLLDWEMPGMDGAEFTRRVRLPNSFPYPNVPIIMLAGHGEHSHVPEAMRLGVHEFLLKPVSSGALLERIVSVLSKPRPMVRGGDYYGPERRRRAAYKADAESYNQDTEQLTGQPPIRRLN